VSWCARTEFSAGVINAASVMLGLRTVACLAQHYCTIVATAFMLHALCDSVFISLLVCVYRIIRITPYLLWVVLM